MLRKVTIVFEETDEQDGKAFNVYVGGDNERLLANIPSNQMSVAEWWASRAFSLVTSMLQQANVVDTMVDRRTAPPTGAKQ